MPTTHRSIAPAAAAGLAAALIALAVPAWTAGAATQPAPPDPGSAVAPATGLEEEVRSLNRTLGELVGLLRRQLEGQNATVLMQRVQLMTSRMAPLEQELRDARAEERQLAEQIEGMELMVRQVEEERDRELVRGEDAAEHEAQLERMQIEIDLRFKQVKDRRWRAEQRVIELEQRLERRRVEIETWEAEIDRYLGLR